MINLNTLIVIQDNKKHNKIKNLKIYQKSSKLNKIVGKIDT